MLSALPYLVAAFVAFHLLLKRLDRLIAESSGRTESTAQAKKRRLAVVSHNDRRPEGSARQRRKSRNHLRRISRQTHQENTARIRLHPRQKLVVMKGRDE